MKKHKEHCDYHGQCKNKAYREVYPVRNGKFYSGWNYLCRKHFGQEVKKGKKFFWARMTKDGEAAPLIPVNNAAVNYSKEKSVSLESVMKKK